MNKMTNDELDIFLIDYISKKNSSVGVSASNIHHFNRNIGESKIRGRLKALSNRGKLRLLKKAYSTIDDEIQYINIYFPIKSVVTSQ